MLDRCLTRWLRPLFSFLSLAAVLALAACGGGSGAPNNPYAAGPTVPAALTVLPATSNVYSGTPATVTISGGTPPYRAFSGNSAVLPVAQNVSTDTIVLLAAAVTADVTVNLSVQDASGTTTSAVVIVHPAPLLNTLSVLPSGADCTTNVCSGQTAQVTVKALGPGGATIAGRQIRFDVVAGAFAISTNNPATPLAQTLTVTTDASGLAQVQIVANANATTQTAQIRATDVTTGQQQTAYFVIQQSSTATGSPLTVVPETAKITGAFVDSCSLDFRIDYYIYGGTPPYRVTSTFPLAVNLLNTPVAANGGFFTAITNGTCVDPLVFSIVDAAGKQVQATLQNVPGTATRPTPPVVTPPALVATPSAQTVASCAGKSPQILVSGGTPPYNMYAVTSPPQTPAPTVNPITLGGTGSFSVVYPGTTTPNTTSVVIQDSSSTRQTVTATITCT